MVMFVSCVSVAESSNLFCCLSTHCWVTHIHTHTYSVCSKDKHLHRFQLNGFPTQSYHFLHILKQLTDEPIIICHCSFLVDFGVSFSRSFSEFLWFITYLICVVFCTAQLSSTFFSRYKTSFNINFCSAMCIISSSFIHWSNDFNSSLSSKIIQNRMSSLSSFLL